MNPAQRLQSLILPEAERRAALEALRPRLSPEEHEWIQAMVEFLPELLALLEQKNMSIDKLRRLIFGARTESLEQVCGPSAQAPPPKTKPRGHGRKSHRDYPGARRVAVSHDTLKAGDRCPDCQRGKLREQARPATAISISAQPPIGAVIHEMERLRCDGCGKVFTAPTPPEAGLQKYDPSVGVMTGLLRYGSGMPFYRLERLQHSLGVPIAASVQWEQVQQCAQDLEPVLDHLIYLAAQSSVICNDDTTMRVGQLRQQIQAEVDPKRTGIFTTGVVGQDPDHPIALFFTGRDHAGENLARVLNHRESDLPPPLHMADGLPRNHPKGHDVHSCNCVVHARRHFVDVRADFPQECRQVLESLAEVYRIDARAKAQQLDPQRRLELHQTHSQPVMEAFKTWLEQLRQTRQVEPNSTLGQAIDYTLDRWEPLTQFLRLPGAPLDNNATERILKMSILHRKNSLAYRTQRGAQVGDLFMTLIQTCRANRVNPFDYLMAVVTHAQAAKADPGLWMPWNYTQSLADLAKTP